MSVKVESITQHNSGLKVEGELGGELYVVDESESSENEYQDSETVGSVGTVAKIPNNLIEANKSLQLGTVAVTNSENVQFGNNTYFNGPVTIKQIIQNNSEADNAAYQNTEVENFPNGKSHPKVDISNPKSTLKRWHILSFTIGVIVVFAIVCATVVVLSRDIEKEPPENSQSSDDESKDYTVVLELCAKEIRNSLAQYVINIMFILTFLLMCYLMLTYGNKATKQSDRLKRDSCKIKLSAPSGGYRGNDLLISQEHLRIVSRTDWLAQPVEEKLDSLRLPAPWVIITHTATESCFSQSACVLRVRLIQTFHIESRGWSDIGYNFLVGGDGSAYYGRGWDSVGAHTKGYNKYSIAIAFVGTFNTESPTKNQVEACKKLINLGVANGKLAKDYKILAHRQLMSTLSPGDKVFDIIRTWPHFFNGTDISSIIPPY